MVEFKARRHRLELPPMPSTDDPKQLKRAMDQMKRLVQDEFNRLSTDFYDFKLATFNAGIIPLRAPANITITKNEYSASFTWELPDGDDITPTEVQVRILEISPNTWATYTYPKTSWSTSGLVPGTQYTFQIRLRAVFEATDSFVSTTRNCPSVPVLRTAESSIKAKVFTTDDGVGPPIDNGTDNTEVIFRYPETDGTPGAVGGSDCWWGYKFQYRAACAWADTAVSEAFADGNVGDVTIDTGAAPFTTYPNALFRLAYREICNGVTQDWVYGEPFMAADFGNPDCLGISKSISQSTSPFATADMFALPAACQGDGTGLQIVDGLTQDEFFPMEPGFKCIEYIDDEWTIIADDTTDPAVSNVIYTGLLQGTVPEVGNLHDESDFTISLEIKVPDNSLVLAGGTGAYTILNMGGAVLVNVTQNVSDYSITVVVPRSGGGSYVFRADNLAYATWNSVFYVHDVSEADGRQLWVNQAIVDTSSNAFLNEFSDIDNSVTISTVNDMQIRKVYGWTRALTPAEITSSAFTVYNIINSFSPVGYWPYRDTSSPAVDIVSANNGVVGASVTLASQAGGDGFSYPNFPGSAPPNGVIDASHGTSYEVSASGAGMSVVFILRRSATGAGTQGVVFLETQWGVILQSGAIRASLRNGVGEVNTTNGPTLSIGPWYLVVVNYPDLTSCPDLYVNGTMATTGTPTGTGLDTSTNPVRSGSVMRGNMAHLAIIPRELTPTEIATLTTAFSNEGW